MLTFAAFASLSVVVWASMNPQPFSVSSVLSAEWNVDNNFCSFTVPRTVNYNTHNAADEERITEELVVASDDPPFVVGPVSANLSAAPFRRHALGAAGWSWTGAVRVGGEIADASMLLRRAELLVSVALEGKTCSMLLSRSLTDDRWARKLKFAGAIVVAVCLIHTLTSKLRPTRRR